MGTITKNLDTIIGQAIHGPKVDGIPLYAKIDGTQEVGFNNRQGNKSDKWIKATESTFTSPTNIRKVFITGGKVEVQLYKPAIVKGKADTQGCWRKISLTGDNNLYKVVQDSLDINRKDRVVIKGTGLGALSSPWVASNIEEVYFDWTILASEIYKNAGIGCNELLQSFLQGKRGYVKSNIALEMFIRANGGNIKDLRARYPRLKVVGLISNLGKILEYSKDRGNSSLKNVEDSIKTWVKMESNIELIKSSGSLVIINEINSDLDKYNTNFSLRDGIYKFDRDILSYTFSDYEKRVKEYLKEKSKGESLQGKNEVDIEDIRTEKSSLEELLDTIEETQGLADAKSVLILTLSGVSVKEVNEVFKQMSTEGEKKYRKLLG